MFFGVIIVIPIVIIFFLVNLNKKLSNILWLLPIPLISWWLYYLLGSPQQPDKPWQAKVELIDIQGKNLQEIVNFLEVIAIKKPEETKIYDILAALYLELEQPLNAAENFRTSIFLNGANNKRLVGLAESLLIANDYQVNEEIYKISLEALSYNDKDIISYSHILQFLLSKNNIPEAIKTLEELLTKIDNNTIEYKNFTKLYNLLKQNPLNGLEKNNE
ncbi:tetratricopeptide repeat protein [Bartonella sp. DGB1]|uniref:tetratricopeptide repeat protein n=1 Tax=Bartonella sp. DGB1 TaxID=3239807 RepID=UPI003525ABAC